MGLASCLAMLVMAHVSSARAAEGSAPASGTLIPLPSLVADALAQNPEIRFYQAEIEAAQAGRKLSGRLSNPTLSTTFGEKRTREANGSLAGEGTAWSVSLSQNFEWPGRIGLRKAIANRDVELATLGLERFRAALAARVRAAGFQLFAAQEKRAAAQEVADRFQALREVLVQRDPAGLTPLLETRVIEATEVTLRRRAAEASSHTQSLLLELNQLTGRPLETALTVAPAKLSFRPIEATNDFLLTALTNNFEIRVRATELAQQGFRVELARNERYPGFSVGPMISEERSGQRDRIFGVGLSIPLPLWTRGTENVESARARQTQAETSLWVTQREVTRLILEAVQKYQSRMTEMSQWRADSAAHFREAAELADRHYRLGAVPVSTYVELQKQYLEAVESLFETRRDALEAAQEIQVLSGTTREIVVLESQP